MAAADPTDRDRTPAPGLTRRRALAGISTAGLATPVLAACGGGDESSGSGPDTEASPATSAPASPSESGPVASTADVPVGGGLIVEDQGVVVTQPEDGEFRGFSNICTHSGCAVNAVEDGTINCACHGSRFSISTGEPEQGPATDPLPEVQVSVDGDEITLA